MYKLYILIAGMFVFAGSCVTSAPGVVRNSVGNPIITIGAGEAVVSGLGDAWRIWYIIDTATETCWIKLGDAGSRLSCCDLYKVEKTREHLKWVDPLKCGKKLTPASSESKPLHK